MTTKKSGSNPVHYHFHRDLCILSEAQNLFFSRANHRSLLIPLSGTKEECLRSKKIMPLVISRLHEAELMNVMGLLEENELCTEIGHMADVVLLGVSL